MDPVVPRPAGGSRTGSSASIPAAPRPRSSNVVLVDRHLPAADGVLAAGDVANAEHPLFGPIRIEHWAEALNQGPLAGRNLAGAGGTYDRVPYFYSDQFDLSLSYLGHLRGWDEPVVRGSREVAEPKFVA